MTAPALYKHFASKQALLQATIMSGLEMAEAAITAVSGLDAMLEALASVAIERRDLWVLISREAGHLDQAGQDQVGARFGAVVNALTRELLPARPELAPSQLEVLARAMVASFAAPSQYVQSISAAKLSRLLCAVAAALARVSFGPDSIAAPTESPPATDYRAPRLRRDEILDAAKALFARDGYQNVSMDDIGAAVNKSGPTIYHHFTKKSDILASIMQRAVDRLEADRVRALLSPTSAEDLLRTLVSDYASLSVTEPQLFRIFTSEPLHLEPEQRVGITLALRDNFDYWIIVLREVRPDVSEPEARLLVSCARCIVNELSRSRHLREADGFGVVVTGLALAALGLAAA